jgi:hypothetical protein
LAVAVASSLISSQPFQPETRVRRRFKRILCGLVIAFLLVRLIAPIAQEWQWKWVTIHAERAEARRAIEKQFNRVTVEDFTSSLPGALAAATACEDKDLTRRAHKAKVFHVKKGPQRCREKVRGRGCGPAYGCQGRAKGAPDPLTAPLGRPLLFHDPT